MLPLLILVVPPTAIGGGYLSWSAGQRLLLAGLDDAAAAPPSTWGSNVAGLAALAGTYGVVESSLGRWESTSRSGAHHGASGSSGGPKFVQPKSVGDLMSRIGPPVLARLGAASFAFFCAGAVQAYVTSRSLAAKEEQPNKAR